MDMQFVLTELKEQEPWLREYHSKMLQMVVHKIDANKRSLNVLQKKGYKVGKLNFKREEEEEDYNSFAYNQSGFKIERHGNTDLLWLAKIGYVEIRLHRTVDDIKQITIIKRASKWFAVVVCCKVARPIFRFINPDKSVGIDVDITKFAHDYDNNEVENPLFLKKMLKPLRRADRKFTRRQKGSKNK
jgi:putative transposase